MSGPNAVAARAEAALRGTADSVTVIRGGERTIHIDVRRGGQSYQAWHTTFPHTQVAQVLLPGGSPMSLNAPDADDLFTWGLHSPETRWATLVGAAERWPGKLDLLCSLLGAWLQDLCGGHETGRYVPGPFAQLRWDVPTPAGPAPLVITAEWRRGTHHWTADHPAWIFETCTLEHLREQLQVHFSAS